MSEEEVEEKEREIIVRRAPPAPKNVRVAKEEKKWSETFPCAVDVYLTCDPLSRPERTAIGGRECYKYRIYVDGVGFRYASAKEAEDNGALIDGLPRKATFQFGLSRVPIQGVPSCPTNLIESDVIEIEHTTLDYTIPKLDTPSFDVVPEDTLGDYSIEPVMPVCARTVEYELDGKPTGAELFGLSSGEHTVRVRALDNYESAPSDWAAKTFTVPEQPATLTVNVPVDSNTRNPISTYGVKIFIDDCDCHHRPPETMTAGTDKFCDDDKQCPFDFGSHTLSITKKDYALVGVIEAKNGATSEVSTPNGVYSFSIASGDNITITPILEESGAPPPPQTATLTVNAPIDSSNRQPLSPYGVKILIDDCDCHHRPPKTMTAGSGKFCDDDKQCPFGLGAHELQITKKNYSLVSVIESKRRHEQEVSTPGGVCSFSIASGDNITVTPILEESAEAAGEILMGKSTIPSVLYIDTPAEFVLKIKNTGTIAVPFSVQLSFEGTDVDRHYSFESETSPEIEPEDSTDLSVTVTLPDDAIPANSKSARYNVIATVLAYVT